MKCVNVHVGNEEASRTPGRFCYTSSVIFFEKLTQDSKDAMNYIALAPFLLRHIDSCRLPCMTLSEEADYYCYAV